MKKKHTTERLEILQAVEIHFDNLGLLAKTVKIAQVRGQLKYYVWLEDGEDDGGDDIAPVPLDQITQYNPNVCKSKQTAYEIFNFYVSTLERVNNDTIGYFESKTALIGG